MPATDAARLARAATLQVRSVPQGRFVVTGGAKSHTVRLSPNSYHGCSTAWCDCADFATGRGKRFCKHLLAVAITQASDEDRAAIAHMLGIG